MEWTAVPRIAIELPLVLPTPEGFEPTDPATWALVNGRIEYVKGRLLYMPPCGDDQQDTAADLVAELTLWVREHPGFVAAGNEAGVLLGGEVRGADGAIFASAALGPRAGGFRRVAPILAAEIAGKDESQETLVEKADWYLGHGVEVGWILLPATRTVLVKTATGIETLAPGQRTPEHGALPGLAPLVSDLFRQLSERG